MKPACNHGTACLYKPLGLDLERLRREVAFDCLLCRLFRHAESPRLLRGGYAMELRIRSARTTRDIDLGLVDLLLLIETGTLDADRVGQCIEATFRRRDTHPVPSPLGPPPQAWAGPFEEMAGKCGLSQDLVAACSCVAEFIARLPGQRLT